MEEFNFEIQKAVNVPLCDLELRDSRVNITNGATEEMWQTIERGLDEATASKHVQRLRERFPKLYYRIVSVLEEKK